MDIGTIFLIQPAELVGTNRYKIGFICDKKIKEYINNYLDDTRFILILESNNVQNIINEIKTIFKQKFNSIASDEYYEGNENDIKQIIINIIDKYLNFNNNIIVNNHNSYVNNNDDIDYIDSTCNSDDDNATQNDINNIDKNDKLIDTSLQKFIKNNLHKKKHEFVTIKNITDTYYKNEEYLKLKNMNITVKKKYIINYLKKYKWFNENFKEKHKDIRSVLLNYIIQ